MKGTLVLTLGLTLAQLISFAQSASIEGIVTSVDGTLTIPGASVFLEKTSYGSATNGQGFFKIENVPAGNYILVVSSIGYGTHNKEINLKTLRNIRCTFYIAMFRKIAATVNH